MYTHMTWIGDALVVNLPKTKGDQEGSKSYPKHMYAVLNQLPPGVADDVFQVAFKSLMESDAENGTSNKQTPRRVELWYCLQCLIEKKISLHYITISLIIILTSYNRNIWYITQHVRPSFNLLWQWFLN